MIACQQLHSNDGRRVVHGDMPAMWQRVLLGAIPSFDPLQMLYLGDVETVFRWQPASMTYVKW
jgi:hypothetical protein